MKVIPYVKFGGLIGMSLLFIGCSGLMQTSVPEEVAVLDEFHSEELGIGFQYPEEWGEVVLEDSLEEVKISFSDQPVVHFLAGRVRSEDEFLTWCEDSITDVTHDDLRNENGEDTYVKNGRYTHGNCEAEFPYLYSVASDSRSFGDWMPADEQTDDTSEILLNKSYYIDLTNPHYPNLRVSLDLPNITSAGTCLLRLSYMCDAQVEEEQDAESAVDEQVPSEQCPLSKNLICINYEESELVRTTFTEFESGDLGKQVEAMIDSLTIEIVENPDEIFENKFHELFADLSEYSNTELGVSFTYPKIYGNVEWDEKAKTLGLSNGPFKIQIRTLEDAIASDLEYELNPGPTCNRLTATGWEKSKERFSNYRSGDTVEEDGLIEINGNKMFLSKENGCGERIYHRRYVTFVGDKHFEISSGILVNPDDLFADPAEFYENYSSSSAYNLFFTSYSSLETPYLEGVVESLVFSE